MKFDDFLDKELQRPEFKKWWLEYGPAFAAGNLLIKLRADFDLTQQELADRAGVKRSYIARIENGNANPTVKSLARILNSAGFRLVLGTEREPAAETKVDTFTAKRRTRRNRVAAASS